jgi:glycosyltransferase involved in cell wall biosynthesis
LRILYHHRTQGRGAEGVHITSIVHALERMGHEVTVLSPAGIDPLASAGAAPVDKSRVPTRGVQTAWKWISRYLPNALFELAEMGYNFAAARRLERELAAGRYDIVYERYAFFLVAGALKAAKHKVPFILEANEVSGIRGRARRQTFGRACALFERALFHRCAGILAVSSHLRDRVLARGVPPDRVRVVPNAVDLEKFASVQRDATLTARLGLNGRQVIVVAGWFDAWDRLDFLVEALARLVVPFPHVCLLVVGDGPVLARARQRIDALRLSGHAVFAGAVPRQEVLGYLSQGDVAVLPHSNEFGSPIVMFEYMGLRVPIVAPRLPPIEDVHVDARTALLFSPLDLGEFVAQIEAFLGSIELRKEIATCAFEKLAREHTWECNARQILRAAHIDRDELRK